MCNCNNDDSGIVYGCDYVKNFRLFGYATGAYLNKCPICKKEFMGDKHAVMCLECAIKLAEEPKIEKTQEEKIDVKTIIQKEVEKHRGELIQDSLDIVELVDFAEDDEDYYYVVLSFNHGIYWTSAFCTPIWLKDKLSENIYNGLKKIWDLNKKNGRK